MKKILCFVVAMAMIAMLFAGCTSALQQGSAPATSAPAPTVAPSSTTAVSTAPSVTANPNNDDLVGPDKGPDFGFGQVGCDMATLVERMAAKATGAKIYVQVQQLNEPWIAFWSQQLQAYATQFGLKLIINDSSNDVVKEASDMDAAVNAGAAGIILFPIDTSACIPAVNKAVAEGVPVVSTWQLGGPSDVSATTAVSEYNRGVLMGNKIVSDFAAAGKKGFPVIASIAEHYSVLDGRVGGLGDIFATAGSNVTYDTKVNLRIPQNDFSNMTAKTITLLNSHPEVNAIMCCFSAVTPLVTAGIAQTGRTDVSVYCIDVMQDVCQQIKDGVVAAGQPIDAKTNSWMALFTLLRLINGDKNVPNFSDPQIYQQMIITKDNVVEYAQKEFGVTLK